MRDARRWPANVVDGPALIAFIRSAKNTVNLQVYNPLVHVAPNNLFDPISSGEIYKNAVPSRNYRHHHKHIELLMGLCFPVQNDMNNNSRMVREHEHNIVLNAELNYRHSPKSIE